MTPIAKEVCQPVNDVSANFPHLCFCSNHMCPITNQTSPTISRELRMLLDKWSIAWLRSPSRCPSSFHLT